jgi:hypothetical protein
MLSIDSKESDIDHMLWLLPLFTASLLLFVGFLSYIAFSGMLLISLVIVEALTSSKGSCGNRPSLQTRFMLYLYELRKFYKFLWRLQ